MIPFSRILSTCRERRSSTTSENDMLPFKEYTLADVPPGDSWRVVGFSSGLSADRRAYLQAYGLVPGHWVRVIQHSPVTVVLIEHTELALEEGVARQIRVAEE